MKTIFVMVKCDLGKAYDVADMLVQGLEQVSEVHSTSGQYDLLLKCYLPVDHDIGHFVTERIEYNDARGVRKVNVVGKKGDGTGGMAYFGHTDVVPPGDGALWTHEPFGAAESDGKIYGRGAADMKSGVAAFIAAAIAEAIARRRS